MSSQALTTRNKSKSLSPKQLFNSDSVQDRFQEILGNKSQGFMTSVLQCVSNNKYLKKASTESIYNAAMSAAVIDLPINNNMGLAYIVPYKGDAQLQIGWKGFVRLALRTGRYKSMNVTEIYEGEVTNSDPLKGYEFDRASRQSDKIIGYAARFELSDGFSKTSYMTVDEIEAHAKEYSQAYRSGHGPWTDNFKAMALKTVIKGLLTKWGPMSIDMQKAATFDQGVVKDVDKMEVDYVDNQPSTDGTEVGKQIAEDVVGSDDVEEDENLKKRRIVQDGGSLDEYESDEESDDSPEPEDANDEGGKAEPYKPTKKQRENLLSKAEYMSEENQSKLVKFINKDDMTEEGWQQWMEYARKAEKKAKEKAKAEKRK